MKKEMEKKRGIPKFPKQQKNIIERQKQRSN